MEDASEAFDRMMRAVARHYRLPRKRRRHVQRQEIRKALKFEHESAEDRCAMARDAIKRCDALMVKLGISE